MVILTFWRRSCFHARAMKISLDEWQEYLGVLAVELVRCAHCSDTVWLSNPNCVDLKKSRSSTSTQSEKTVQGFLASPVFLFVGTISDWNMWKELCYFFWDMYPKSGYCHLFPRKKPLLLKFRNVVDLGIYIYIHISHFSSNHQPVVGAVPDLPFTVGVDNFLSESESPESPESELPSEVQQSWDATWRYMLPTCIDTCISMWHYNVNDIYDIYIYISNNYHISSYSSKNTICDIPFWMIYHIWYTVYVYKYIPFIIIQYTICISFIFLHSTYRFCAGLTPPGFFPDWWATPKGRLVNPATGWGMTTGYSSQSIYEWIGMDFCWLVKHL